MDYVKNRRCACLETPSQSYDRRNEADVATASSSLRDLAMLNETITGQAAIVAVIDQFKVLMLAMLTVSQLVLFLRKSNPAN